MAGQGLQEPDRLSAPQWPQLAIALPFPGQSGGLEPQGRSLSAKHGPDTAGKAAA